MLNSHAISNTLFRTRPSGVSGTHLHNHEPRLPLSHDQQQRDSLAKKWLALTLPQREPYTILATALQNLSPGDPLLPTQEQITRMLAPYQTVQERSIGGGCSAIWLRTCYLPELNAANHAMTLDGYVLDVIVDPVAVFDDAALYDSVQWDSVLLRMPSMCDSDQWGELGECPTPWDPWEDAPPQSDHSYELFAAYARAATMVNLLDQQALEEGLVTVMWLDNFGECVWWVRVQPDDLQSFCRYTKATGGLLGMLNSIWGMEEESIQSPMVKGIVVDWL